MKKTMFNLSHEKILSCNMGNLVPVMCEIMSPGDVWRQDTSLLLRTQPLLAPVMHKVDITVHHWFVPNRIMMNDWEKFITGGENGIEAPSLPRIIAPAVTGFPVGSLADYLGFPTGVPAISVSAFPFRAYTQIWNQWYRDEQLQTALTTSDGNGTDTTTNTALQNGSWGKDYFTAARPQPQLGTAVTIPLTGNAPVIINNAGTNAPVVVNAATKAVQPGFNGLGYRTSGGFLTNDAGTTNMAFDPNNTLLADLSSVSAVNIDDLREASAIQRFKERMNRTGARYTEYLRSMFRVTPQDSRLQLPEYLGGGQSAIQFSEVLQTSATGVTGGSSPLAELAGHGIGAAKSNRFKYACQEHGVVMTLLCVRPKTVYSQGIRRPWLYNTKYDFLLPDFANLGDQEVFNGEIYAQGTTTDNGVWGFTPKYDEYRYIPNTVAGQFRTTLNIWHMARNFTSLPALNAAFVSSNPTNRVYAITSEDQLQIRALHKVKVKRCLPKYNNPTLK